MTKVIELQPIKTIKPRRSHKRSHKFTTAQVLPYPFDDGISYEDESPIILDLNPKTKKSSKRNNIIQTLPFIINAPPATAKTEHHPNQIQQFIINTQPPSSSPKKKELVLNPIIGSTLSPSIQYVPISAPTRSLRTIVERDPFGYRYPYTPNVIEERPSRYHSLYESPVRRVVRAHPSNADSVYLPQHAKQLVNRFVKELEHAHGYRVRKKDFNSIHLFENLIILIENSISMGLIIITVLTIAEYVVD